MSIGERLALAVKASDQSLRDFASLVEVPYRTLQDYVGGQREPRSDILAQICTRSRVSPSWLLLGEGDMLRAPAGTPAAEEGEKLPLEVKDGPDGGTKYSENIPAGLAKRIEALSGLLAQLDPGHTDAILAAAIARAADAQRLAELEQAVSKIAKPRQKKRANGPD